MSYRRDIDGLRAIAVIPVIGFHSGVGIMSGGYIGVDVFFVISGYLITSLIIKEVSEGRFLFSDFYSRRVVRLAPALIITLLLVMFLGFFFYHNPAFDKLGKEVFYSAFGLANILFAQGTDYFAKDEAYQPLIHLWSLGVEEQFYLLWPITILAALKVNIRLVLFLCIVLFLCSLLLSIRAVGDGITKGYFLLHYRAFELLIGCFLAIVLFSNPDPFKNRILRSAMPWIGLAMIVAPIIFFDEATSFPGLNALIPCLGTMFIIAFSSDGLFAKLLSNGWIVTIGLISYPLYLFHQPVISFLHYFNFNDDTWLTFAVAFSTSGLLAWLTHQYVEKAIKKSITSNGKTNLKKRGHLVIVLVVLLMVMATLGFAIAKTNGLGQRFKHLNTFSYELTVINSSAFHRHFVRGLNIADTPSTALFLGDSVLQHYVLPIASSLGLEPSEIDTVTRGGCVLLKDIDFIDTFSDISCNSLQEKLYLNDKRYRYVFISQSWDSYNTKIRNFEGMATNIDNWTKYIGSTINHFSKFADIIVLIGDHPLVTTNPELQPSMMSSKSDYLSSLKNNRIENILSLKESKPYFQSFEDGEKVIVLHPYDIFCQEKSCKLDNGEWSFFSDQEHLSQVGSEYVAAYLLREKQMLSE